jgi:hypothetical protein
VTVVQINGVSARYPSSLARDITGYLFKKEDICAFTHELNVRPLPVASGPAFDVPFLVHEARVASDGPTI